MEILLIIAAMAAVRWLWHAWMHPFAQCGACGGTGKNKGSTGKRWGTCRRCNGERHRQVRGSRQVHSMIRSASGRKRKD